MLLHLPPPPPSPPAAVTPKRFPPFLPLQTKTDTGLLFREKLLYLQSLNIDPLKALNLNPTIRSAPLSSLAAAVSTLSSTTNLPLPSVARILDMHPSLLTADPNGVIFPVIHFLLHEIRLPTKRDLAKSLTRCPRLLVSSVDLQLRPALTFLQTLGFVGRDRIDSRTTVLLVSSVEQTLIPKIEYLISLGFSRGEVERMVVRSPAMLTFSIEKNLVPKVEYLVEEMGEDLVEEIKRFPQYFSFSLERKIKPRHRLLVDYGMKMPLPDMLKVSDGEFRSRLVEMRLRSVQGRSF